MDKAMQIFNYNGKRVRTVEQNGDERSAKLDALGGVQTMTVINEPGLYRLAFRSNKPEAKAFARWVTHEGLPQIRQHGMYLTDKVAEVAATDPTVFDQLLARYVKECKKSQVAGASGSGPGVLKLETYCVSTAGQYNVPGGGAVLEPERLQHRAEQIVSVLPGQETDMFA